MRQWVKRYLSLFLILVLCAGCGKTPEKLEGSVEEENREQSPAVVVSREDSGRTYRVEQTISLEIEDPEGFTNKTLYSGSYGSTLYLLAAYQLENETESAMWIYTFDLKTLETEKFPFTLETPGMENPYVDSMTVTGQDELTFRLYGVLEGKDTSGYLYRTDITGRPLDEELPFSEDRDYPPVFGKFYAVPDGSPFLAEAGDSMTTNLSRYDEQNEIPVSIATVNDFINALCSDGQGGLYYMGAAELKHLSLNDMVEEKLCRIDQCGIKLAFENWLLSDEEGRLAFCSVSAGSPVVYLLTDQEDTSDQETSGQADSGQAETKELQTIRMVNLHNSTFFSLSRSAADWSASSDSYYRMDVEDEEDDQALEALRTRTMADLVSGQGPELMYVSADDLRILAEMGALADLSELIGEDIQEQLLPGVRQLGVVDDVWVGVNDVVYYFTLITSDTLWSKNGWTVSELLDLADSKNDWGDWILSYFWAKPDYNNLFDIGFSLSMGDSPFMDLKNGISYFNGEEFIRTLEFCKKYGQPSNARVESGGELRAMVQEEKSIAMMVYLYDGLQDFSNVTAAFENCHMVGFPSETGSGNYVYYDGYLVVNANADNIDAVKDFLAYILDYDRQFGSACSVRKDVLRDQVGDDPNIYSRPYILVPDLLHDGFNPWPINNLKPDGTTYLEEFMEFAESCEPVPYCPDAVSEIIQEEIGAYFNGNRSAKDTADIIHRRVQLYFDERN